MGDLGRAFRKFFQAIENRNQMCLKHLVDVMHVVLKNDQVKKDHEASQ